MKVVLDIPHDVLEKARGFMAREATPSLSAYVVGALQNQFVLEETDEGALSEAEGQALRSEARTESDASGIMGGLSTRAINWAAIPAAATGTPNVDPLWGQYGRYLPVKVALRTLAYLQLRSGRPITVEAFHEEGSALAARIREYLDQVDARNGSKKGSRLAAGLPHPDFRSLNRYSEQTLGRIMRTGQVVGALPDMRFVHIDPQAKTVELTTAGLEFAKLENPVLDQETGHVPPFAAPELRALMAHLKAFLPGETHLMESVLEWISGGIDTPDMLLERFQQHNPDWTEKVASMMRTGAIARMADLGLIARQWNGTNVRYLIHQRR